MCWLLTHPSRSNRGTARGGAPGWPAKPSIELACRARARRADELGDQEGSIELTLAVTAASRAERGRCPWVRESLHLHQWSGHRTSADVDYECLTGRGVGLADPDGGGMGEADDPGHVSLEVLRLSHLDNVGRDR